jgi:hypothetical protein
MENATKQAFQTTNPNSDNFSQFENARLMNRLAVKFTPKPYWKNYALLRGVVLCSSYLFNVLSAATAAALVFFSLRGLLGSDLLAGAITGAALIALELVKRETGQRFFHDLLQFRKMSPGLAGVVVLMMALSTTASYFGAKRAVTEFTPPPVAMRADSLTAPLMAQISATDAQIKAAAQMKKKGVVTASAQRTIERLSKQKETALGEVARIQARTDTRNDNAETKHELSTKINANGFAAITLVSEILLLLTLWYLQFYDYRSFVEYCEKGTTTPPDGNAPPLPPVTRQNATTQSPPTNGATQNGAHVLHARADVLRATEQSANFTLLPNQRTCEHCAAVYEVGHRRQRFCGPNCRIENWQQRNGKEIRHRINVKD